jgi:hypothetical protein
MSESGTDLVIGDSGQPWKQIEPKNPDEAFIVDLHVDATKGNDRLTALVQSGQPWVEADLIAIVADSRYTITWRNYCIQHLADWYEVNGDMGSLAAILDQARQITSPVCDVSIFSLARLANNKRDRHESAEELHAIIMPIIDMGLHLSEEHEYKVRAKVAAIRSVVLMRDNTRQSDIIKVVSEQRSKGPVLLAATDAIGLLQLVEARSLLMQQAQRVGDTNPGLTAATYRALTRLSSNIASRSETH